MHANNEQHSDRYRRKLSQVSQSDEEEEVENGRRQVHWFIQRDGTAPAPERTAERKKDRRILAGYGKGGMEMAVDRAKKERDEKRAARKEAFSFLMKN